MSRLVKHTMRILYSVITYIAIPFLLYRFWLKRKEHTGYGQCMAQRLGFAPKLNRGGLWLHACSVGEVNIAIALLPHLKAWPHVLVTTHTAQGRAHLLQHHGLHSYIPLDCPIFFRRFLRRSGVVQLVLIESEIWPNLIHTCARHACPVSIINGRISDQSFRRSAHPLLYPLTRYTLDRIDHIYAQSLQDKARYHRLGVPKSRLSYFGNLKYEQKPPLDLKEGCLKRQSRWGKDRLVVLAASTHEGEEAWLLEAWQKTEKPANTLLIIAPRHPHRCPSVMAMYAPIYPASYYHTDPTWPTAPDCIIVDTIGELWYFYEACDIALVCGSFVPIGGHNPIEPACLGKPIITGPYLSHATAVYRGLKKAGGHEVCRTPDQLAKTLTNLLSQPQERKRRGQSAHHAVMQKQPVTQRTIAALSQSESCEAFQLLRRQNEVQDNQAVSSE